MEVDTFPKENNLGHLWPLFYAIKIEEMEIVRSLNDEEIDFLTDKVPGDKIRLRKQIDLLKSGKREISTEILHLPETKKPKIMNFEQDDEARLVLTEVNQSSDNGITGENPNIFNEDLSSQNTGSQMQFLFVNPIQASTSGEVDLRQLFSENVLGQALIEKSKSRGLINADRDRISDIVITHCLNKFEKMDHAQFDLLAENLAKLFPTEKKSTYFIPPIKKKDSRRKKSERARGKLVEKYRNKRHLLKSLSTQTNGNSDDDDDAVNILKSSEVSQEAKNSQIILKNNPDLPPAEVSVYWRQSFSVRKLITNTEIEKYLDDWPVLKTQLAYELMSYDFEQIHKSVNYLPLQEQFDKLFDQVFCSKHGSLNSTDSSIAKLLKGGITTDSKNSIKLYLLSSLLPSKARTKLKNKKQWKPSIAETRDAICVHANTPEDVDELKNLRVDIMSEKGLTVQPYIILIGPNLGNITSSLVIINEIQYKCNTVLEALDFCFKAYQVLEAKYPFEAEHLWYLIQWSIYNYETKNDITFPFLNEFL
ncbi:unnamed protein product [Ceutorhynchus assimilis]|uniref:Uncharacterized protein n=1 Tax=Ceutorhynchus assimilis TaxID=467358 RepID=A0A9N9MKW0_9CUCU|nr:unnamed protein product [Ceutorhynchus assimilis]